MILQFLNKALILFIFGCTSAPQKVVETPAPKKHTNFRKFASSKMQMSGRELDLAECFQVGKDICYSRFPYKTVQQEYFAENSNFSNRKEFAIKEYQDCVIEENLQCAYQFNKKDLIINLNSVRKNATLNTLNNTSKKDSSENSYYDWLKLNSVDLVKLWHFITELKRLGQEIAESTKSKALNKAHGHGVSFGVNTFAGMGVAFNGEVVVHDQKLALFCAPGVSAITDLGVQMGVGPVRTLGCKEHKNYLGNFLTVSAGVSSETFGLPTGAQVNYSLGFNLNKFVTTLQKEVENNNLDIDLASVELVQLITVENMYIPSDLQQRVAWFVLLKVLTNHFEQKMATRKIDEAMKKEILKVSSKHTRSKHSTSDEVYSSLGQVIKALIKSTELGQYLNNKEHLKVVLESFSNSLTGCDSVSGDALLALSVSPINFSLLMSNYALLYEVDLQEVANLQNLSAFMLMNPMLLTPKTIQYLLKLSKVSMNLDRIVANKCYIPTAEQLILNASKVRELINN